MHNDNNPKTRLGSLKVPMHLIPPSAKIHLALALEDGAGKYGPYNWREEKISASVYRGAMERHGDGWWDGEDLAGDSGVLHLAHIMACCALLIDAAECGMLIDDRPANGSASRLLQEYHQRKTESTDE
jgi:hypothetical protein